MRIDKGLDGRGLYRSIYCAIWSDSDFRKFSPDEKLVFLYLRTSPLSNLIALYPFWIEPIEQQTGLSREAIQRALSTLSDRGWIAIEDGLVWIKKGLRFDPQISLRHENHLIGIKKAVLALPRLGLVRDFIDFYGIDMPYPIPPRSHLNPSHLPYTDQDQDQEKEEGVGLGKGEGMEEGKPSFSSKKEMLKQQARQLGVKL